MQYVFLCSWFVSQYAIYPYPSQHQYKYMCWKLTWLRNSCTVSLFIFHDLIPHIWLVIFLIKQRGLDLQYTQGHIVVDHLQRRTACHVWLGVYRCLLIAHLLCEYLIVAKLGVVNLYLKVIKLWLTCTCSCIYLIIHYNFNSIILDK